MVLIKWVRIDRRNREPGTYSYEVQEDEVDTDETDPLELGQALHDTLFGVRVRRYFV